MKRADLIAGLAARRFPPLGTLQDVQQRAQVCARAGRIATMGEVLERLRDAQNTRNGSTIARVGRDDRCNGQVFERRKARLDLHPLASIPLAALIPIPASVIVHRLSGVPK